MNALVLLLALAVSVPEMNLTPSPDSTMEAFTRGGDLWVRDIPGGSERRLTTDGGGLVSNGYASSGHVSTDLMSAQRNLHNVF